MPYDGLVNRLDSWLNRQASWRQVALAWLLVCPVAAGLGLNAYWIYTVAGGAPPGMSTVDYAMREMQRRGAGPLVPVIAVSLLAAIRLPG